MLQNLFHYVLIVITLSTLKVAGFDGALTRRTFILDEYRQISQIGQHVFEKSGISEEERSDITREGFDRLQATISTFDYDRSEANSEVKARLESHAHPLGKETGKIPIASEESLTESKQQVQDEDVMKMGLKLDHEKLKNASLKRKKGYITFEDGENDDHLQNLMACLYDNRIPEMIVIHGGNGHLRYATYQWFWKAAHELTGCEVPEILLGGKGTEEPSVFDLVEGIGGMDEAKRQELLKNPMDPKVREQHAQETYAKVADHISKLDRVFIGLKTAPTDLVNVIDRLGIDQAKEKMFIVWSCPGAFSKKEPEFPLLARFNVYRNHEASDKIYKSGINMVLTGNDLYATRVKGFMDAEFAKKMGEIDSNWKDFEGFKGLKDLAGNAPEGSIFNLYRKVQQTFQVKKVIYGQRYLTYVINPVKEWLEKIKLNPEAVETEKITRPGPNFKDSDLMSGKQIEEKLKEYEQKFGDKLKELKPIGTKSTQEDGETEEDIKAYQTFTNEIDQMIKGMNDLDHREGHLVRRWEPFSHEAHFLEGCTADPHLEFFLNPNMRKSSVKEVIPVKFQRNNPDRPNLLTIQVQRDSNCWLASDLDSTDFFNMHQGTIDWFTSQLKGEKPELPWIGNDAKYVQKKEKLSA
ncbi:hypothetical protein DFH28DRAFT_1124579 [Melampsora americana]|nr:hypothetical protein DFH28DRAFT_1124579 [Melampsora americana]